jgi:6-phosphofructokinase 1
VIQEKFFTDTLELESSLKFMRAGNRKTIYFQPNEIKAAIVTCGGLCPGLNVVIRSIVQGLSTDYGVK